MTISSYTPGVNPTGVDNSIVQELRSLAIVLTEYVAHRKTLEELRATCHACLAAFIISMLTSAVLTNSWIAHSHGENRPVRNIAPKGHAGVISVRDFLRTESDASIR